MRYILKLAGTNEYLYEVHDDTYTETTTDATRAKVYSDSMIEERRLLISKEVRRQFGTIVEVVRVI